MKANELKFKVTNKKTGESAIISLDDLFGYEGEENGVFICYNHCNAAKAKPDRYKARPNIPNSFGGVPINYNSGYGYKGFNEDLEFDYPDDAEGNNGR